MPMAYAADRALISRSTLHKIERGDPGVSLGAYATVLFGFGMIGRLEQLVDKRWDWIGLAQEEDRLPRRIRSAADCEVVDTLPLHPTVEELQHVPREGARQIGLRQEAGARLERGRSCRA
jgi:hypothetical protein